MIIKFNFITVRNSNVVIKDFNMKLNEFLSQYDEQHFSLVSHSRLHCVKPTTNTACYKQCSARVWDWERVFGTGFGFSGLGSGLGKHFYTRFIWERGWKYSRKPNYLGTGLGMGLGLHKHIWVLSPGFSGFLTHPFPFPKAKIFDTRGCLGTKFSKASNLKSD